MATRSFPLLCQCCISIYQCLQRLGLGRNDCCQPMYMFTETKLGRTISYKNQFSPRMHPDLDLRIFYIGAIIHWGTNIIRYYNLAWKFEYYIMHRNMISNYYLILSKVPRDVWIQLRSRKMWSLASSWAASKPSGHIFWNRIFNSMSYGYHELFSHLAVCSWIIVQAETPWVSFDKKCR